MRKGKENQIIQFLLDGGKIRGAILDSSALVEDMRGFHGYGPVETLISGQMITAAALLSVTVKGEDRMRLSVECGGPIAGWHADLNAAGDVRGHLLKNPIVMDSAKAVTLDNLYGPGFLHLMRSAEGSKTPFTGSVELRYPDLASNLAYYYLSSEQTPSALNLAVDIGRDGKLNGAAGLFLQALPGADEEVLNSLHEFLLGGKPLFQDLVSCGDAGEWILERLTEYSPNIIGLQNVRYLSMLPSREWRF